MTNTTRTTSYHGGEVFVYVCNEEVAFVVVIGKLFGRDPIEFLTEAATETSLLVVQRLYFQQVLKPVYTSL